MKNRLHIGCGHNIFDGWVNHDCVFLPGVDVVHDLTEFFWPWQDESIDEIYMKDVLEHLPDTIRTMEEIYRITRPGAKIYIAVPYWNSFEAITDPTHVSIFNEFTFEFFDPSKRRCQERSYYTKARFHTERLGYGVAPLKPAISMPFISRYRVLYHPFPKKIIQIFASFFSNIIIGLEVYLVRV